MSHLSPETVLSPDALNSFTYTRLINLLTKDDTWRKVAESFGIFSDQEIQRFSWSGIPAETLILELGARLCSIGLFCDILQECHLYDIILLFKNYEPLSIVEQPANGNREKMVIKGTQLKLICRATGLPIPGYQWYCGNQKLESYNNSALCIDNFGLPQEGDYFCIVSQEGYQKLSSNSVFVTMAPEKPVIVKQPSVSVISKLGATVVLSVTARGHPELTYQWYHGNKQLDGSTGPELIIKVENVSQDGVYRCYIKNTAGEVWTNESIVSIYATPSPEPSAKVALLIGNQLYDNVDCLNKPENDVKTLADILEGLGFLTVALQDLNLMEMRSAICYFAQILPKEAYVVFYFSGHGFEICDKFMLPVDAPGPEHYRQADALSERELLKIILGSQPKLLLELLDMCLKPPDPLNKKILQEKTILYEYEGNSNLIQGYATTSYLGAYEKKSEKNGLYIEHLKHYLTKKKDMPIVEMLRNVAKDMTKVCPIQKPFFGTNVTMDYRLTDQGPENPELRKIFDVMSVTPKDLILSFNRVNVTSKVTFAPFLGVFLNTLEVRFSNLQNYKVTCEAPGEEIRFKLSRIDGDVVIKIMNIQRLISDKTLTIWLSDWNNKISDCAKCVIGKPLIAAVNLP